MTRGARTRLAQGLVQHLIDHCAEHRQPVGLCLGREAARSRELHAVAGARGLRVTTCLDPACLDPCHVTLLTEPVGCEA